MQQVARTLTAADDGVLIDHRVLICDRDRKWTPLVRQLLAPLGIRMVQTPFQAPNANPFVERVIGTLRRECLDYVIVWNERSLLCHLQLYLAYYHEWRTHLSLAKDAPVPRAVQPPACGRIIPVAHVGGLHHHYERRAA
jgi:putative transposase